MRGSGPKIFIVVLFLIAIVFVLGINLGASHSNDQTLQTPAWLKSLAGALASPQRLKIADLSTTSTSCLQHEQFVIPVGSTCVLAIKQSLFTQRIVVLQLVQGASAIVTLTQEQILPVQQTLKRAGNATDANLKVYPGKVQGMLTIRCLGASGSTPCLLQLN